MAWRSSSKAMAASPNKSAKRRRRSRANQRGSIYVQYLVVTFTVSFATATAIVKLGPILLQYHREAVTAIVVNAP